MNSIKKVVFIIVFAVFALANIICGCAKKQGTFPVTVNYDIPIGDAVKTGNYDWVEDELAKISFISVGSGKESLAIILIQNTQISARNMPKELDRQGLRPANIQELLAFGAAYPEKQKEHPIVALGLLGQDSEGLHYAAYLDGLASQRSLRVTWMDYDWLSTYWYAAVRKPA